MQGATAPELEGVEVVSRPALQANAIDVLEADGYLLGTPANIGYMSGALKHFFDQVYYPCLTATRGRPYGLYVHGASDATGAVRSVEVVVRGLAWRKAAEHVVVIGPPTTADLDDARELGSVLAGRLLLDA
jgi:NAD(P)H-dependent FMN reductase